MNTCLLYTSITNELSRVKGVGNVGLFGMGDYSMRIWLEPDILTIRGITPADVISAIESQNIQVAAGSVGAEPVSYTHLICSRLILSPVYYK